MGTGALLELVYSVECEGHWNGGGGGSRTPVRKALRPEAYMLSSIRLGSPAAVRMSKKRSRLVRWISPGPYGPKGPGQLTVRRLLPGPW